jgi:GH35 family endo-1,4-beta-xylanase
MFNEINFTFRRTTLFTRSRRFAASLAFVVGVAGVGACAAPTSTPTSGARIADRVGFNAAALFNPTSTVQTELNAVRDIGARWIRGDFNWPTVERSNDRFEWTAPDRLVNEANARGLRIMGTITYTPAWANVGGGLPSDAEFGEYAGALAQRYKSRGVHHWEIWNEANLKGPWPGVPNPAKYTSMLKAAYNAIKAADPSAVVITSGLAPAGDVGGYSLKPSTFVRQIYQNGGKGYFDAVGLHPHTTPYASSTQQAWNPMVQAQNEIYPVMQQAGDGGKKIWATEVGFTTANDPSKAVSEAQQGGRVVDMIRTWLNYPFAGPIFVYQLRDIGTSGSNWHDHFGLMRHDFSKKPAFGEVRNYVRS